MSNRAGGGGDSPSSTASPDEKEEGDQVDNNPPESISDHQASPGLRLDNIPPPFSQTVDEIDICPPCNKAVTDEGILCEGCNTWFHKPCSNLNTIEFTQLSVSRQAWYCNVCQKNKTSCHAVSQAISDFRQSSEVVEMQ